MFSVGDKVKMKNQPGSEAIVRDVFVKDGVQWLCVKMLNPLMMVDTLPEGVDPDEAIYLAKYCYRVSKGRKN